MSFSFTKDIKKILFFYAKQEYCPEEGADAIVNHKIFRFNIKLIKLLGKYEFNFAKSKELKER